MATGAELLPVRGSLRRTESSHRHPSWHRFLEYAWVTIALMLMANPAAAQELLPIEVVFLRRIAVGKFVIGSLGLSAFVCLLLPSRERSWVPRILAPLTGGTAWLYAAWTNRARIASNC